MDEASSSANQHAAFGNVGGLAANEAGIRPELGAYFAGQAIVPPTIAGLALAQEYRHPHLELFGKRDDAFAVLLHGFPVAVGAGRGVADFGCAF